MNKLQKLFESKIVFAIKTSSLTHDVRWVLPFQNYEVDYMDSENVDTAIEELWQAAKKHYPGAKCFKIEEKNNFDKWKDFFNDLPPFMCDRFCEVLAKKFDEAGLDSELIPAELMPGEVGFKEEK